MKVFTFAGYPENLCWYLNVQLKRKRKYQPAPSWVDRCEAPSTNSNGLRVSSAAKQKRKLYKNSRFSCLTRPFEPIEIGEFFT